MIWTYYNRYFESDGNVEKWSAQASAKSIVENNYDSLEQGQLAVLALRKLQMSWKLWKVVKIKTAQMIKVRFGQNEYTPGRSEWI